MRAVLKSRVTGSSVGWFWLWALVLLVLPDCSLDRRGLGTGSNVSRGSGPHTSTILCDIERDSGRHCATSPDEINAAIRLASGAVALVAGQTSATGLDDSPAALARCGGMPEIVRFQGPFPEGSPACLDCSVIGPSPSPHPTSVAVCVALCEDLFSPDGPNVPPTDAVRTFCENPVHAHLSTNFPSTGCFADACTTEGTMLRPGFVDPRRTPEPVIWQDVTPNANAVGGTLTRTGATSGSWDAGAASTQVIASGDGYVEFTAAGTTTARIAGLSSGAPPDTNANFTDIGFGIDLFSNGEISIFEGGSLISTFGPYAAGEKFRVKVKDNFDGSATISYARLTAPCVDGMPCSEAVFYTSLTTAAYPFRVDASLFTTGATLTDVRLVRIH
jgi:hypothetical protein